MIPQQGLDDSPTTTLVDWPFFCRDYTECKWRIHRQKIYFQVHKNSKIGAMLGSFFRQALPTSGLSISFLLFGLNEARPPSSMLLSNPTTPLADWKMFGWGMLQMGMVDSLTSYVSEASVWGMHLSGE